MRSVSDGDVQYQDHHILYHHQVSVLLLVTTSLVHVLILILVSAEKVSSIALESSLCRAPPFSSPFLFCIYVIQEFTDNAVFLYD